MVSDYGGEYIFEEEFPENHSYMRNLDTRDSIEGSLNIAKSMQSFNYDISSRLFKGTLVSSAFAGIEGLGIGYLEIVNQNPDVLYGPLAFACACSFSLGFLCKSFYDTSRVHENNFIDLTSRLKE